MRASRYYLILPLLATAADLLIALLLLHHAASGGPRRRGGGAEAREIPAQREVAPSVPAAPARYEALSDADEACGADETGTCAAAAPGGSLDAPTTRETGDGIAPPPPLFDDDPNMRPMPTVDFTAYVRPDVSTFYGEEPGTRAEVRPAFSGQAGKFINMSPERMQIYWEPGGDRPGQFQAHVGGFEAAGTGTYPGHTFTFRSHSDPSDVACRFTVRAGTSVYFYDPFNEYDGDDGWCAPAESRDLRSLGERERRAYETHRANHEFGRLYRAFTGAEWLSLYPRSRPRHDMWRADHFGQVHTVETKETHFKHLPPPNVLGRVSRSGGNVRSNETEEGALPLRSYRDPSPALNLTLTALSCAPRIFEIRDFLSDAECDHILDLATGKNLARSMTGDGASTHTADPTRTSVNTWLDRMSSPVVDAVYRRAADVLRVDEALLRDRDALERPDLGAGGSLAEALQLVHYDVGQEYTAHHDFGYPTVKSGDHPSRWANLLLYPNGGMDGGETSFPRWRNAETSGPLNVRPEKGKAVLFYMILPDGNLDDLTHHAALPVLGGEKWLANLWVWDPQRR